MKRLAVAVLYVPVAVLAGAGVGLIIGLDAVVAAVIERWGRPVPGEQG